MRVAHGVTVVGFDALRPVLESYFDREIVVKR